MKAIVIAVPVYFSTQQHYSLKVAATIAGFDPCCIELVPAPVATLIGYSHSLLSQSTTIPPTTTRALTPTRQLALVIDIGGNTMQLSLLESNEDNELPIVLSCLHEEIGGNSVTYGLLNSISNRLSNGELRQANLFFIIQAAVHSLCTNHTAM